MILINLTLIGLPKNSTSRKPEKTRKTNFSATSPNLTSLGNEFPTLATWETMWKESSDEKYWIGKTSSYP